MAIKRAKYWNADNQFHFETDDKAVKILDSNNNEIGTLRQLMFEGKPLANISYRSIKRTGIYMVQGFTDKDLPAGIPNDKNCILSVTAVGTDANNPEVIFYKIITPNGKTIENTVSRSASSGWGEGGVDLRNTLTRINNSIGDFSETNASFPLTLQKDFPSSWRSAPQNISEALMILGLATEKNSAKAAENSAKIATHNHDDRYLRPDKSGVVSGTLLYTSNTIWAQPGDGNHTGSIGISDGKMTIDARHSGLALKGTGALTYNGQEVITKGGSGVDADTLGGFSSGSFVNIWSPSSTLRGDLGFSGGKGIVFGDSSIKSDGGNGIQIGPDKYYNIVANNSGVAIKSNGWSINALGEVLVGNTFSMKLGGTSDNAIWFPEAPYFAGGGRLFLGTVSGNEIPDGSVWITA